MEGKVGVHYAEGGCTENRIRGQQWGGVGSSRVGLEAAAGSAAAESRATARAAAVTMVAGIGSTGQMKQQWQQLHPHHPLQPLPRSPTPFFILFYYLLFIYLVSTIRYEWQQPSHGISPLLSIIQNSNSNYSRIFNNFNN